MAFPGPANYHADSDADDEYERSVFTSPMPPTDDEASSTGDSDRGSHEHTPTTFEGPEYDRASPRTVIRDWTSEECTGFLSSLGLSQYNRAFKENGIVGDILVELHHDELKEMGVISMGHRLTILGAIYDMKVKQDIPVEHGHYVPPSKEDDIRNRQATQDDLSRIIHSLQLRDQRIIEAETELKRMQEEYRKLREELLPVFKMVKENRESLPSPVFPGGQQANGVQRKPSTKNPKNLALDNSRQIKSTSSPTWPQTSIPSQHATNDQNLNPSAAVQAVSSELQAAMSGINFPSPQIPSPGPSPGMHHPVSTEKPRGYGSAPSIYSQNTDAHMSGTTFNDRDSYRPPTSASTIAPSIRNVRGTPSIREQPGDDSSAPAVEVFKSFRVSMDDPCYKVLPAALRRYNIQADWKQFALYIVYGDQERCLGLEEKPLILFKQLDKEGRKPMFMLRRHVTPQEGYTSAISQPLGNMDAGGSKIQLPGGVL